MTGPDSARDAARVQRLLFRGLTPAERFARVATAGVIAAVCRVAAILDDAGAAHALTGAFARGLHGVPRTTLDVALVLDCDRAALRAIIEALDEPRVWLDREAARRSLLARSAWHVVDLESCARIELRMRPFRPRSREELARRLPLLVGGAAAYVITAEDAIVGALEEHAHGDAADIVGVQGDALDRAYLERWVAELGLAGAWAQVKDG